MKSFFRISSIFIFIFIIISQVHTAIAEDFLTVGPDAYQVNAKLSSDTIMKFVMIDCSRYPGGLAMVACGGSVDELSINKNIIELKAKKFDEYCLLNTLEFGPIFLDISLNPNNPTILMTKENKALLDRFLKK